MRPDPGSMKMALRITLFTFTGKKDLHPTKEEMQWKSQKNF